MVEAKKVLEEAKCASMDGMHIVKVKVSRRPASGPIG